MLFLVIIKKIMEHKRLKLDTLYSNNLIYKLHELNLLQTIILYFNQSQILQIRLVCKILNELFKTIWCKKELITFYNSIDEKTMKSFDYMENFNFYKNNISDVFLSYSFNIYFLITQYSQITDIGLSYLKSSKEINISGCTKITNEGLYYLKNIKSIVISNCRQITDEGISNFKNLISIDLTNCIEITDKTLFYLKNIKQIILNGCNKITDNGLEYIQNAQKVSIKNCDNITDKGVSFLKAITIFFDNCIKITNNGLYFLPNIKEISLVNCNITDEGIKYLKNIDYLNISNCIQITDKGLSYLENVKKIKLSNCKKITKIGIQKLQKLKYLIFHNYDLQYFEIFSSLKSLDLKYCSTIRDIHFVYFKNIEIIGLSCCQYITGEGFINLNKVKQLDISECSLINESHIFYLTNITLLNISKCKNIPHLYNSPIYELKKLETLIIDSNYSLNEGIKYLRSKGITIINI